MNTPVKRPAYVEDTPCAQYCCRHPLSSHVEGERNPYSWLGPEWPTGCETRSGIGDAGYESCACSKFVPPLFISFSGGNIEAMRKIETHMQRRHWRDTTTRRWVIQSHGCEAPGHMCDQKRVYELVDEVNTEFGVDIMVNTGYPTKIKTSPSESCNDDVE